jgi:hypothetical protein
MSAATTKPRYYYPSPVVPPQTPSLYLERLRLDEQHREAIFNGAIVKAAPAALVPLIQSVWDKIKGNIPGVVRVPYFDLMASGGALLTWDTRIHHLDVEIHPDTTLDFFYLNRDTGEAWDVEGTLDERLPERVLLRLNLFRVVS